MKNHIFSIVTPIFYQPDYPYPRFVWLNRAITSVINQTYQDFEIIVVDDGCIPKVETVLPKHSKVKIVDLGANKGRMIARTRGMEAAEGEWIAWCDSDDTYVPIYLECINEAINLYPKAKVFNFGSIIFHKNYGVTIRPTFKPKKEKVGHEVFASGQIGSGSFVFHRSVFEDLGGLPEVTGLWTFAEHAKKQFPELEELYPGGKELGNPFGDDYYYFYKITRKYHSQPLNTALYCQHVKEGHKLEK